MFVCGRRVVRFVYRLYNDDCLKVMPELEVASVDLILCDLPYGTLNKTNPNAQWDKPLPFDTLWENYSRVLKPNGVVALFGQGVFFAELILSNRGAFRYDLVWDKQLTSDFLNADKKPMRVHEQIAIFYNGTPTYNPQMTRGKPLHGKGMKYKQGIKNSAYGNFKVQAQSQTYNADGTVDKYPTTLISVPKPHPSVAVHTTQKPVELLEWLIRTYTNEGDLVLDNCMGSGSTGVAALNTNRNFIGIESDSDYYKIASDRIKDSESIVTLNLDELI